MSGSLKLRSLLFKKQIQKYKKRKKGILGFFLIVITIFITVYAVEASNPESYYHMSGPVFILTILILPLCGVYFLYVNSKRKKIQVQFMTELVKSCEIQSNSHPNFSWR